MARRLTTNQEIAGSIPASINIITTCEVVFLLLIFLSMVGVAIMRGASLGNDFLLYRGSWTRVAKHLSCEYLSHVRLLGMYRHLSARADFAEHDGVGDYRVKALAVEQSV